MENYLYNLAAGRSKLLLFLLIQTIEDKGCDLSMEHGVQVNTVRIGVMILNVLYLCLNISVAAFPLNVYVLCREQYSDDTEMIKKIDTFHS
jgi:hypothetical protein